ncbi:RNA ligase family protein [Dactylosporangium sp. CS-033363]|uniref:RNA ligase family protein n=1 Tax=Dactylosporangium sp. CS-033363 TaxID=3239935 RepID=UPI003D90B125
MEHVTYPKIPAVLAGASSAGPWIATEKIHGAQLAVAWDGATLRVGKRKAWLRDDEPFFGWQLLRATLERTARAALARGGSSVRLYGELYGGHYPSVPPVPGASAVQTGVWYCPDVRFALFDVLTDDGPAWLFADVVAVAAEGGADAVPLLARGSRSTVDAVPIRFATRVPALHGLPALEGNLAEGVVLRPDARVPLADRPTLKRKIPEFDEARFDEAQPWHPHLAAADVGPLAATLVNLARVASARSKAGPSDPAALLEELVLDVMLDLVDAYPALAARADLEALVRPAVVARFRDSTVPGSP